MKGLVGKKLGMTRYYTEQGVNVPVTVVAVGPCVVLARRTAERDGYSALQLGFGSRRLKNVRKPIRGQLAAAKMTDHAPEFIREVRLDADPTQAVGDVLGADVFAEREFVDVIGISKGRGFAGVVKRHHFAGGRASHGGGWLRRTGSIGMKERPGKIYKQRRMPGHMGNEQVTVQNLQVVKVLKDENLLLIRGAIPGPNGREVVVKLACKRPIAAPPPPPKEEKKQEAKK